MPDFPSSHPMMRGRQIHSELEYFIQGRDEFPKSGKKIRETLDYCHEEFIEGRATVEDKWGFTREWNSVDWMANDVWLRMATDCFVSLNAEEALIYDWKTGKSFGNEVKYMQQMQLYAVGAFARYPDLSYIDVNLAFVDDGKIRTKGFSRDKKLAKLMARFHERGEKMTSTLDFRPKPNIMNCRFCPFGPMNGTGACVYGVEPL